MNNEKYDIVTARIEKYEQYFDEISGAFYSDKAAFFRDNELDKKLYSLISYYESEEWRSDYELDEKGGLPNGLKRGILSEDGIYNLISDIETEKKMNEIWNELYNAAKSVQNGRKISEYVEVGGVAAAILSKSGKVYTGVCVDTCSTLGICAERNAIFNMLTCGEQDIDKVIAIMPDGKTGAPCGACRELMVQLMPDSYKDIEIMLEYEDSKVITLGELTPEWWI